MGSRVCNELWRSSVPHPRPCPPPPTPLRLPGPPGRATGQRVRWVRCGSVRARASGRGFLPGCSLGSACLRQVPKAEEPRGAPHAEARAASCPHPATCNALRLAFWFPAVSRCLLFLLSKIVSFPGNLRSSRPPGACCLAGAFLLSSPGGALPSSCLHLSVQVAVQPSWSLGLLRPEM